MTGEKSENAPLITFNIGVLGSSPLDFTKSLADEINAEFFSADVIRNQLFRNRELRLTTDRRVGTTRLRELYLDEIESNTDKGLDTVGEIYFNSPTSREIPISFAEKTGALVIGINVHTPYRIVKERIRGWIEEDRLVTPIKYWSISPEVVAKRQMTNIIRPTLSEPLDYLINVVGSDSTEVMVESVYDFLLNKHLIE